MSTRTLFHFVLKDAKKAKEAAKAGKAFTPTFPDLLAKPFWLAPRSAMDEIDLWREVAARMILDALGATGLPETETKKGQRIVNEEHVRAVAEARDWFVDCLEDVEIVFGLAGVDFKLIRGYILDQERKREKVKHSSR